MVGSVNNFCCHCDERVHHKQKNVVGGEKLTDIKTTKRASCLYAAERIRINFELEKTTRQRLCDILVFITKELSKRQHEWNSHKWQSQRGLHGSITDWQTWINIQIQITNSKYFIASYLHSCDHLWWHGYNVHVFLKYNFIYIIHVSGGIHGLTHYIQNSDWSK